MTAQPPNAPPDQPRPSGHATVPPQGPPQGPPPGPYPPGGPVYGQPAGYGGAFPGSAPPYSAPPSSAPPSSAPPSSAPPAKRRRSWAVLIALVAVVVALAAVGVAGFAVWRVSGAVDRIEALEAGGGGQPAPTAAPPAPDPTADPTGDPTGDPAGGLPAPTGEAPTDAPPAFTPQTVFDIAYQDKEMRVQVTCSQRLIDLDLPQVDAEVNAGDLDARKCEPAPRFVLSGGSKAAEAESLSTTPFDCFERINLRPIKQDVRIPARQGLVLCVLTSKGDAEARGDLARMALVQITGVATDDTITMRVTAYKVPRS